VDSKLINNSQFGGKPVSRLGSVLDHCIKQQRFINELPSLLILLVLTLFQQVGSRVDLSHNPPADV